MNFGIDWHAITLIYLHTLLNIAQFIFSMMPDLLETKLIYLCSVSAYTKLVVRREQDQVLDMISLTFQEHILADGYTIHDVTNWPRKDETDIKPVPNKKIPEL